MISHENCALKFIYIYSPVGWSRLRKDSNWCGFITMSGYHSWETTSMTRTLRKTAWMSPPAYFQRMRRSWKSSFTQVNDQFILSDVKSHESWAGHDGVVFKGKAKRDLMEFEVIKVNIYSHIYRNKLFSSNYTEGRTAMSCLELWGNSKDQKQSSGNKTFPRLNTSLKHT